MSDLLPHQLDSGCLKVCVANSLERVDFMNGYSKMSGRINNKNKKQKQNNNKKPKQHKKQGSPQRSKGQGPSRHGVFRQLGSLVGSSILGSPGTALGQEAGAYFGKITGMGAYKLNRNSLMTNSNGPISFSGIGEGTVITHREFLTDITGSAAFTIQNYYINPGLVATFPWLSAVAAQFEQYEMLGLVFEYRPTCANSVGTTNTALGTVVMATDYDVYDTNFSSKQQMEAYEFATSCVPYNSMVHPVECSPRLNILKNQYIRTGAVTGELHFYDVGNFQLATVGMQQPAVIGELWVSYKVRLLKPKIPTPIGSNLPVWHARENPIGTADATHGLGTGTPIVNNGSTMTLTCTFNTIIVPTVGKYLIFFGQNQTAGNITAVPTLSFGANMSSPAYLFNAVQAYCRTFTVNYGQIFSIFTVDTPGVGAANTVTLAPCTGITAGYGDVVIAQISSGFNVSVPFTLEEKIERIVRRMNRLSPDDDVNFDQLDCKSWDRDESLGIRRGVQDCAHHRDVSARQGALVVDEGKLHQQVSHGSPTSSIEESELVPSTQLSDSYLIRVGEALGVRRSASGKKQ